MKHGLKEYLSLLTENKLVLEHEINSTDIEYISYNSKDIKKNTLFICKGAHFREEYLQNAVNSGAVCYISDKKYDNVQCGCIIVSNLRRAMALCVNLYFERVWEGLNLVGITGTKGKSTTTYFLKYILDEYLQSMKKPLCGYISSIDTFDGVNLFESHLTTPEPIELNRHFKNACDSKMEYLVMEVSSQALKYDRVYGVEFKVGCYLNIGEDHISDIEHPDFDDYFHSKLKLFSQCETACVCLDSQRTEEALKAAEGCKRVITFSSLDSSAEVYGYDIKKVGNDTSFKVRTSEFDREFMLTIPGLFNVQNALAAIAVCKALDIPEHFIYVGLMKARSSGRMEIYTNVDSRAVVIVDYAHNKLSFENLYESVLKEFPGRKIFTVFGCPGKKAFQRRRDLGTLAGHYSDKVFLTEEDSGEEPLLDICREIAEYVKAEECPYEIIEDRGEAIRKAIFSADTDSIILVTGKGNETRQKRGTEYVPCPSDVEYTLKYLKEFDVSNNNDAAEKIKSFHDVLPAFRKLYNKTVLVKLGGGVLENDELAENIAEDISLLQMVGARVVIVHGGGKRISKTLRAQGIETGFLGGYRITDEKSMRVIEEVLSGGVNKDIVSRLRKLNLKPVGISGKDGGLIAAAKKTVPEGEIGFVGEVKSVNADFLRLLLDNEYIPVISPVSFGDGGNSLNVNADDAALAVAEALGVDSLVFVTDVDGILLDVDNSKTLIDKITVDKARTLLENGFIGGGMLPKLRNCIKSIENGVNEVVILNGRIKYNLVSNFITPGKIGTTISK